jgi:flavorubredoxin
MTMQAPTPKTRQAPTQIAKDTFLVHDHSGEGQAPVLVPLNSMVIRGAEPVVVDTGMPDNRDSFLADVFGLVEPEDVRWVFLSHDDIDHVGNVHELMDACPNATLIVNWFMTERMGCTLAVPPGRWRWIGDGESFDAGDRTLHTVRPPVFDSPTTRGLYDPTTKLYWASDSFASPMLEVTPTIDAVEEGFWAEGMTMFSQYVSPWLLMVDDAKFQASVDRIEALGVSVAAGCHSPAITGEHVGQAIDLLRTFPKMSVPDEPGQAVLEEMLAAIAAAG